MYIKARGLYNNLSDEYKELYDTIIAKTETETFKKLTKKEIAYLYKLYEEKVAAMKKEKETRIFTYKDVYVLALSIKLRNLLKTRNVAITQSRYNPKNMSTADMTMARFKLERTIRAIVR